MIPCITCPNCGRTSYHPQDVENGYCGACHEFFTTQSSVIVLDGPEFDAFMKALDAPPKPNDRLRSLLQRPSPWESNMTDEEIEIFAIQAALGNNGGSWAKHYTPKQKERWRQFVRDLAAKVEMAAYDRGVADGRQSEAAMWELARLGQEIEATEDKS